MPLPVRRFGHLAWLLLAGLFLVVRLILSDLLVVLLLPIADIVDPLR